MFEVNPVRELDAANPHVQFDEREVETGLLFAGTAPSLDSTHTENVEDGLDMWERRDYSKKKQSFYNRLWGYDRWLDDCCPTCSRCVSGV